VDFRGALQQLAERAGVELEESPRQAGAATKRRRALELHGLAQKFFAHVLWETEVGAAGRQLLRQRGLDDDLARRFSVGFAPAGGETEDALARFLVKRAGATLDEMIECGLAHRSRRGGPRDRFRNRLTFAICDDKGAVIGFGARAMGDDQPKYLNSSESPIYHKSAALFGLNVARDAIRDRGATLVVEGYFDVIAAHRAGVTNVVASSGTAFTREQVRMLARLAPSLILCFDADAAGLRAVSAAVDVVAAEQVTARIVELPAGYKDPDELVRDNPQAFAHAVEAARAEWQVLVDRSLADAEGGSVEQRRAAAEAAAAVLRRIPNEATRDLYLQQVARRLDLSSPATLASEVARGAPDAGSVRPSAVDPVDAGLGEHRRRRRVGAIIAAGDMPAHLAGQQGGARDGIAADAEKVDVGFGLGHGPHHRGPRARDRATSAMSRTTAVLAPGRPRCLLASARRRHAAPSVTMAATSVRSLSAVKSASSTIEAAPASTTGSAL
jgi:DNA primase